jgi:hypothetical protein
VKLLPNIMFSGFPPLMSMSDLQIAQVSALISCPYTSMCVSGFSAVRWSWVLASGSILLYPLVGGPLSDAICST